MTENLNKITELAGKALKDSIGRMNAALATAPPHLQPFFTDINTRLMEGLKNKDVSAITQAQSDIMKFIENERLKTNK